MKRHMPILLPLFLICAAPAAAAELDAKLRRTAEGFAADAAAKLPELAPAALAVFPFQADEKLAKKRVGVAVAELLTQKLLVLPRFRLVERARLDEVFREQKLALSGAIESETAARVGKTAGARLLAMGSVAQMGRNYQVSAKLVDSESSEIVSASIFEVPAETFDAEASRYLVLVPETQAVGLYLTGLTADGTSAAIPAQAVGARAVPGRDNHPNLLRAGAGVRYFPAPRWAIDSVITFADLSPLDGFMIQDSAKDFLPEIGLSGLALSLFASRQAPLSRVFNLYAGAGVDFYDLKKKEDSGGGPYNYAAGRDGRLRALTPAVRLALEWRPQPRFGISAFASFALADTDFKLYYTSSAVPGEKYLLWAGSLPRLVPGVTAGWYF